ncbi:MAG: ADP-ribosylation factor-like protein [Candidatus Hodarchaeales archaeon]
MTLLAVKVFDESNNEVVTTISIGADNCNISEILPTIRKLIIDQNQKHSPQGWVCGNYSFVFDYISSEKLFLVAIASLNTSFVKLKNFLELLKASIKENLFDATGTISSKHFQDTCDLLVKSVDSSSNLNISLLGLAKSGKTTFIQQYITEQQLAGFNSYEPTRLVNIVNLEGSTDLPQIRFYDLGMAFQQHWWKFSAESDGYIFFVDMSDSNSINASKELLEEIRNFWDLPFVIAANKMDNSIIKNPRRYLSRKLFIPIRLIYEVETSTGVGLKALLQNLVTNEIQVKKQYSPVLQRSTTKNESKGHV